MSGERDPQALWDQMLVRGWIDDRRCSKVAHDFWDIVGAYPSDMGLQRVPNQYTQPIRAFFAEQWPKFSNWLWRATAKTLRTPEFEARCIKLLQSRLVTKGTYSKYRDAIQQKGRRAKRKYKAMGGLYEAQGDFMRAGTNWKTVK